MEEFKKVYREYYYYFNKMLEALKTDFGEYLYYLEKADEKYKEAQEIQKRIKSDK